MLGDEVVRRPSFNATRAVPIVATRLTSIRGSPAVTGEINGEGEPTPRGKGQARNSLCAFSGLQDGVLPDDPQGPGTLRRRTANPTTTCTSRPAVCPSANGSTTALNTHIGRTLLRPT